MKKIIIAGTFLLTLTSSMAAQSVTLTCKETVKSKKENGYNGSVTLTVGKNEKILKFTTFTINGLEKVSGKARRDDNFKGKNSYRYVDIEAFIGNSDAEAAMFVNKSILKGKPGRLVVSGAQPNEGESGPNLLWYTVGEFDCK